MERSDFIRKIKDAFDVHNVVALLGPRQCGKTTIAQEYFRATNSLPNHYFDLEDPVDEARLAEPMTALEPLSGLVVIDEVQQRQGLFKPLRVLTDRRKRENQVSSSRKRLMRAHSSIFRVSRRSHTVSRTHAIFFKRSRSR